MEQSILNFIQKHGIKPSQKILLAVSGGIDSVVLAHLLKAISHKFAIAHCNFNLRGQESDQDAAFVSDLANRLKVPFYTTSFSTETIAQERKTSIQIVARDLRYSWFNSLMEEHSYSFLATAHHLNDNLETTLYHLIKGCGIAGIAGIPEYRDFIIRPLLGMSREEIVDFAQLNNIQWREDTSNLTKKYARNYLRHEVVPKLKKLNQALDKSFVRTSSRLKSANEFMQYSVSQLILKADKKGDTLFIQKEAIPNAGRLALVFELIKQFGFGVEEAESIVQSWNVTGKVFNSSTHFFNIDRAVIIIGLHKDTEAEVLIDDVTKSYPIGNKTLYLSVELREGVTLKQPKEIAILDFDQLRFPILLRQWRQGDAFQPLGMKGKKKLSDFMIDQKIPLKLKEGVLVLESDNKICWVVGMRVDDRFKVGQQTKKVLKLELK